MQGPQCPFCEVLIQPSRVIFGRHTGRHLEEISFAVVAKPYEYGKFYDDTSSGSSNHSAIGTSVPRSQILQHPESSASRLDAASQTGMIGGTTPRSNSEPKTGGLFMCKCCRKKPKKF